MNWNTADLEKYAEDIVTRIPRLLEVLNPHHVVRPLPIETWYGLFQWSESPEDRGKLLRIVRPGQFDREVIVTKEGVTLGEIVHGQVFDVSTGRHLWRIEFIPVTKVELK